MGANPFEKIGEYFESAIESGEMTADEGMAIAVVVGILLILVGIVMVLVGLVIYLAQAFALARIAKKLELERPWLAWIPIAQNYLLGSVAERCDERRGLNVLPWEKILLNAAIADAVATLVSNFIEEVMPNVSMACLVIMLVVNLVSILITIAYLVLRLICVWKIMREFFPQTMSIVMFVISVLAGPTIPLLVACFKQPQPAKWNVFAAAKIE